MDSAGTQSVPVRTHGIDGDICILLQHWQGAVAHALLIGEGPANIGIPHQLRTLQLLALLSIARPASDLVSTLPVYVKHLQTLICLEWASTLSVMQAYPPFTGCHTRSATSALGAHNSNSLPSLTLLWRLGSAYTGHGECAAWYETSRDVHVPELAQHLQCPLPPGRMLP